MKNCNFVKGSFILIVLFALLSSNPALAGVYLQGGLGHYFPDSDMLTDADMYLNAFDIGVGVSLHSNLAAEFDLGVYQFEFEDVYWVGGEWEGLDNSMIPLTINIIPQYQAQSFRAYLKAGVGYNTVLYDVPLGDSETVSMPCYQYGGGVTHRLKGLGSGENAPIIESGIEVRYFKSKEQNAKIFEDQDIKVKFDGIIADLILSIKF